MSRLIGLVVCAFALLLPYRARIWFTEALGWLTQLIYYTYFGIMNYLLAELRKSKVEKPHGD